MLERDNVVIGAGLSGLVAAMRLKGSTLLLSYGMAATAISTGVLSYPVSRDMEAEKWLLGMLSHSECPYVAGNCMAETGVLREGLIQYATNISGSPVPVSFNAEKPGQVYVPFMKGRSLQEIARVVETEETALDELIELLKSVDLDCIAVPPVLGVSRASEIRKLVSQAKNTDQPLLAGDFLEQGVEEGGLARGGAAGNDDVQATARRNFQDPAELP